MSVQRTGNSRESALQTFLAPFVIAAGLAAIGSVFLQKIEFIGFPMLAFVVVCVPILRSNDYDIASPWTFVVFNVAFGVTLRSLYIELEWPSAETVDETFLLGNPPSFFFWASFLIVLGLISLTVGYSIDSRFSISKWPKPLAAQRWDPTRSHLMVIFCLVLGSIGSYLYVRALGGFDIERISAKRTTAFIEIDESYQSFGHWRFLSSFSAGAAILATARYAFGGLRVTLKSGLWMMVLYVGAALIPFYSSSRSELMWTPLTGLFIWHVAGRKIRFRALLPLILVGLIAFQVVSSFRERNSNIPVSAVSAALDARTVVDPIILNDNLLSVTKTGHVIDAIPSELDYASGSSLLSGVVTPIPRAIWANKPIVGSGKTIGRQVFGYERTGVPPSIVAEMYWNFHILGVLGGTFALGWLLRRLYETLRPLLGAAGISLVYVVGIMPLGFWIVGFEVGTAYVRPLRALAPLLIAVFVFNPGQARRPAREKPSGEDARAYTSLAEQVSDV